MSMDPTSGDEENTVLVLLSTADVSEELRMKRERARGISVSPWTEGEGERSSCCHQAGVWL